MTITKKEIKKHSKKAEKQFKKKAEEDVKIIDGVECVDLGLNVYLDPDSKDIWYNGTWYSLASDDDKLYEDGDGIRLLEVVQKDVGCLETEQLRKILIIF